jgi:hypothetical protein
MQMSYLGLEQALPEDPERTIVHDLYQSCITPTLPRFVNLNRPEADRSSSIFFQLVVRQEGTRVLRLVLYSTRTNSDRPKSIG